MKKTVWTFGLISGGILGGTMAVMVPAGMNGTLSFEHAEIFGYTIQVLAFVMVFFGIRSYRQNVGGGAITFGKAFQVGILVVLVASAVYVATWEVIYYRFFPDFGDKYAAHMLEKMKSTGKSAEAIDAATKEMARFKEMYRNPLVNAGMTLLEVLPVGVLMTLASAAILRRKAPAPSPA
jgi:hypothetical protein